LFRADETLAADRKGVDGTHGGCVDSVKETYLVFFLPLLPPRLPDFIKRMAANFVGASQGPGIRRQASSHCHAAHNEWLDHFL
jgi:hypothetical protein